MPDQLQLRGGTTVQHSTFTGASKEVTVDTTKKTVVVHDGSTAGGNPMLREDASNSALALGSAGTPSLKFTGDTNTGIYSPGADQVAISTGGSGRLFVDASGRVGMGAAEGTYAASLTTSGNNGFLIRTGTSSAVQIYAGNTAGEAALGTLTSDPLNLITGGNSRIRITSAGLVGVGTSSPSTLIHGAVSSGSAILRLENTANSGESSLQLFGKNSGGTVRTATIKYDNADYFRINTPAAVAIAFETSDTERLRITGAGLVGIGSSSPQTLLELAGNGTAIVRTTNDNPGIGQDALIGGYEFYKADASGSGAGVVGAVRMRSADSVGSSAYMTFSTALGGTANDVERVRITGAGNVGIGSTSPTQKFQVTDGTLSNFFVAPGYNSGQGTTLAVGGGEYIEFATNGITNPRARIDSSGRLLVGTSSSNGSFDSALQIAGSGTGGTQLVSRFDNNVSGPYLYLSKSRGVAAGTHTIVQNGDEFGSIDFKGANGSSYDTGARITAYVDGTPGASGDMPGRLVFSTTADGASSPTERMRINKEGGTYAISTDSIVITLSSTQSAGTTNYLIDGKHSGTAGVVASGTRSFRVFTNGNVENTNNSYTGLSDIKLKENIIDASSQWDDIKALHVRKYNFKEGQTHTQIGLIAQEVELVSPGLVSESPDRDAEGNDLGTVTKSVNYSVLYMKAVKALQEAMERIEQLEAKVSVLELKP